MKALVKGKDAIPSAYPLSQNPFRHRTILPNAGACSIRMVCIPGKIVKAKETSEKQRFSFPKRICFSVFHFFGSTFLPKELDRLFHSEKETGKGKIKAAGQRPLANPKTPLEHQSRFGNPITLETNNLGKPKRPLAAKERDGKAFFGSRKKTDSFTNHLPDAAKQKGCFSLQMANAMT